MRSAANVKPGVVGCAVQVTLLSCCRPVGRHWRSPSFSWYLELRRSLVSTSVSLSLRSPLKHSSGSLSSPQQCFSTSLSPTWFVLFPSQYLNSLNKEQESRATAKMTARCALYMGALKNFESPWVRPGLLFPIFLMSFCSDRSYECAYKIWSL